MSDNIHDEKSRVFKKLDGFLETAAAYVGKSVDDVSEYVVVFIYQYPSPEDPMILQLAQSHVYIYTDHVKQKEEVVSVHQVLAYMNGLSQIPFDPDKDLSALEYGATFGHTLLDHVDFKVYYYDEEVSDKGYITLAVGLETPDESISIPAGTFDVRIYE